MQPGGEEKGGWTGAEKGTMTEQKGARPDETAFAVLPHSSAGAAFLRASHRGLPAGHGLRQAPAHEGHRGTVRFQAGVRQPGADT